MTTITATPDPATGSVLLDITRGRRTVRRIRRTDANGTVEVRGMAGQFPDVAGTVVKRRNVAQNAAAAYGLGLWSRSGVAGTLDIAAKAGQPRFHFSTGAAWGKTQYAVMASGALVTAAAALAASVQLWTDAGLAACIGLQFKDRSGVVLGTQASPYVQYPNGGTAEIRAVAPAGTYLVAVTVSVRPASADLAAGTVRNVWFDRVMMLESAAADLAAADVTYFDGTTPDTETRWYGWLGAAGGVAVEYISDRVIVTDYEAAAGALSYTVETDAGDTTVTTALQLESPWLLVPLMPNYSEPVDAITGFDSRRANRGTLHEVLDRPDPLPALAGLGYRAGSMTLPADTLDDALRIERVFDRGQVVMLRGLVPAMDMYLIGSDVALNTVEADGADTTYEVSLSYQQVARPAGSQSGALGWTYAALLAEHATYNDLTVAYASYDDMTINRRRAVS